MTDKRKKIVFEVSWEVCNKIGGIYTTIATKAQTAVNEFGENYYLLGPDLRTNPKFEETDEQCWNDLKQTIAKTNIPCRFGRWKIPGDPKVILVDFSKKFNADQLLFELWTDYGIDSRSGDWDYIEPVVFSSTCAEIIKKIFNHYSKKNNITAIAQFHEWICGAGLLRLKKSMPEIATVFTTHATVLGRALASTGIDINKDKISPRAKAKELNISAKYFLEECTAKNADCFTTVSNICASEACDLLGRTPDIILPNGVNLDNIPDYTNNKDTAKKSREKLLAFASTFLSKQFSDKTNIFMLSGRYEFHNKGIDTFLSALAKLESSIPDEHNIIAYLFVICDHKGITPEAMGDHKRKIDKYPISTHKLINESSDKILDKCEKLQLDNAPRKKINVIFMPLYLDGYDGLLNMTYYEVLTGCDLSVFPSNYEPWGYTPLESAAYAVPTVTTNRSGLGQWVIDNIQDMSGVDVIDCSSKDEDNISSTLAEILLNSILNPEESKTRANARAIALNASWSKFYKNYITAYEIAISSAKTHVEKFQKKVEENSKINVYSGKASITPHFRNLAAVSNLPRKIRRLREIAYNMWWAWNVEVLELFALLDPTLWIKMKNNPVRMLESVSPEKLLSNSENESYLNLYNNILKRYDTYTKEPCKSDSKSISKNTPIAYFSAEYGIHDSLPIYSGGLGILSGDTLKSASDSNLPLVGVGLLYKNGYFRQHINEHGDQIAQYPENDFSCMPITPSRNKNGEEIVISLELPGRTLYAKIWEVKIGRITLYLLDTDLQKNTIDDRKVTSRLYCSDKKVRLEQEILLGIGGIRTLKVLNINPVVFHMNEGHSAFMQLERIKNLITKEKLTFDEACEAVKANSVFTTHTPVEAGNETFDKNLLEIYFSDYSRQCKISWSQFLSLGQREPGASEPFFMTVLALKLSNLSNGVSRMHGSVSRNMWATLWKGFLNYDIPISHITNGVHVKTFIAKRFENLFNKYIGLDWIENLCNDNYWQRIYNVPDKILWRTKCEQKQDLINFLIENVTHQWKKYKYSQTWREEVISKINPAALTIGFARRFATYKRSTLIFSDLDRLNKIINNKERPVHLIFAGKAHPNDKPGQELIKKLINISNDDRFRGKIFFIEDYDMQSAKNLLQGVDVWLNTPRRPYEASGTSGEKVLINGGLNLSISDGWWCEAYDGSNGWTIGPCVEEFSKDIISNNSDEDDARSLYYLLEDSVAALFYNRDSSGIPVKWLQQMKNSIATLVPKYNATRMLNEYYNKMFIPTAEHATIFYSDNFARIKSLTDWKSRIPMKFSSLKIIDIIIDEAENDTVFVGKPFQITVHIDPGKLSLDEILVELVIGKTEDEDFIEPPEYIKMTQTVKDDKISEFVCKHTLTNNGQHAFAVRVIPYNINLTSKVDSGLISWA